MKLNEIYQSPALTPHGKVLEWLKAYVVSYPKLANEIRINEDLSVSSDIYLSISDYPEETIPIKFRDVKGFSIYHSPKLNTIEGVLPNKMTSVSFYECPAITSFESFPKDLTGTLTISGTSITSLVGINDHFTNIMECSVSYKTKYEGGLGLILVPGLRFITGPGNSTEPFNIIRKYIGRPDDLFECQAELIDMGFEEYAKL